MDQPGTVRLVQRQADLPEQIHHPARRQWTVPLDQLGQAQTRQVFHHVVVRAVLGPAIVKNLDRVPMRERGGDANFAFESFERAAVQPRAGPDQLDGARPLQQLMLRQVDVSHSARADLPFQPVLAKPAGFGQLASQARKHVCAAGRHCRQQQQKQRIEGELDRRRHDAAIAATADPAQRLRDAPDS